MMRERFLLTKKTRWLGAFSYRSFGSKELVDSFGRKHNYLRMSLTERCNLRCVYCMPAEGVQLTPQSALPTLEERQLLMGTFIDKFGVDKIRFTGGEPTISPHLTPMVAYAKDRGVRSIGITSNGVVLERHLDTLVSAGLTHVNISLDSLNKSKFAKLSRRDGSVLGRVLSSIQAALNKNLHVKINAVLMRGINDDELIDFVNLTRSGNTYFSGDAPDVRFIEVMPFQGNAWERSKLMKYDEALEHLQYGHGVLLEPSMASLTSAPIDRSSKMDPHDTTKWYSLPASDAEAEGGSSSQGHKQGRVGFITTMSSPFCGGCNRVRVTADLRLKSCLFGADSDEEDLLPVVRRALLETQVPAHTPGKVPGHGLLQKAIRDTVMKKHYSLGGHRSTQGLVDNEENNRPMITIGG